MAISGSVNFRNTAGGLVQAALVKLQVYSPEATIPTPTMNLCLGVLNRMLKDWQMDGAHLWTLKEGIIIPTRSSETYLFPSSSLSDGSVGVANFATTVITAVRLDAAASATALTVDDTTGMTAGDKIIVSLDDKSNHITTIASVDSSTELTLTTGLNNSASAGLRVFAYPLTANETNFGSPRQIMNVRIIDSSDNVLALSKLQRDEYYGKQDRLTVSRPFAYFLSEDYNQKSVSLYPVPEDSDSYVLFTYAKAIDDIDAVTDDLEFPIEWQRTIVLCLATELALEFGKESRYNMLLPRSIEAYQKALGWGDDKIDVQITPDFGQKN